MKHLPDNSVKINSVEDWARQFSAQISIETVLNTQNPRSDILLELLQRVRFVVRRTKFVHAPTNNLVSKEMTEASLRAEVHDHPSNFVFHVGALRQHNPIHNAEMICILLGLLDKQGINARTPDPLMAMFN